METKKVLVFIPHFPALSETFIERELSKLIERGNIDLTIFSLSKGKGYISENLSGKIVYERLTLFDILPILSYIILRPFKTWSVYKKLRPGPHNKMFLFMKSLGYALKFQRFNPDVLMAHFLSEPSTIVMIASMLLDLPYGVSAHAKDVSVTIEHIDEKIETAKFITICNKAAYEYLLNHIDVKKPKNVYLNHHGVDAQRLGKIASLGIENPPKDLILGAGRLAEKKGFTYLIEAASILKKRGIEFLCYIIGFGPLYGDLKKQIKDSSLENEVKVLGDSEGLANSNEQILRYLKVASVFAFPSIQTTEGDFDGVATLLIESSLIGAPVVASDVGSTFELITNEETGLIVPQRQPEALADALQRMLQDKELASKLSRKAHEIVMRDFNIDTNVVNLEDMIIR